MHALIAAMTLLWVHLVEVQWAFVQ